MRIHLTPLLALALFACDATSQGKTDAPVADTADTLSPETADTADAADTSDFEISDVAPPTTDRLPASVEFAAQAELLTIVPDLDGDGRDDVVVSTRASQRTVVHLTWPDGQGTEVGYTRGGTNLTIAVGDLDHDGQRDLVLGSAWDHKAEVYFGPFDGVPKPRTAAFHLKREPLGLADRFGAALLVADLDGDNEDDLLVTAPGEGEEACFGTRSTLVYFGPLVAGPGSTDDGTQPVGDDEDDGPAPSRILPATPGVCLGDHAFIGPASRGQALVLSISKEPGRIAYGLPLSAVPMLLTEANSPALPDLTERIDIDGDDLADTVAFDPDAGGLAWTRSSDGARLTLAPNGHHTRLIGVDLDGDGVGAAWILAERFNGEGYTYDFTLAPLPTSATGLVDFTTLDPSWSGTRDASNHSGLTQGDIDGDGIPEVALGNALIRHQPPR